MDVGYAVGNRYHWKKENNQEHYEHKLIDPHCVPSLSNRILPDPCIKSLQKCVNATSVPRLAGGVLIDTLTTEGK